MVALACILLTIFHPAFFLPTMRTGYVKQKEVGTTSTAAGTVMSDLNPAVPSSSKNFYEADL